MGAQLNPQAEIMFLLSCTPWTEEHKQAVTRELNTMGIDGAAFYSQHFRLVEQYYHTFQKNKVDSPGADIFHGAEGFFLLSLYMDLFRRNPGWFDAVEDSEEQVRAAAREVIFEAIGESVEVTGDLVADLDAMGVPDQTKWQVMVLAEKSKQQVAAAAAAVADNLPAFAAAKAKIDGELAPLLRRFEEAVSRSSPAGLLRLPAQMEENARIIPSLASPVAVLLINDDCYYGLFSDKVFQDSGAEPTKEELMMCAKCLSDRSKMEILLCLKGTSRFNLEIAKVVGLTPATVSYHMSALATTGLVDLEKRDGKMFYHLSSDGVQRFLSGVGRLLG